MTGMNEFVWECRLLAQKVAICTEFLETDTDLTVVLPTQHRACGRKADSYCFYLNHGRASLFKIKTQV